MQLPFLSYFSFFDILSFYFHNSYIMKKFLVLYFASEAAIATMNDVSEEEQQKEMQSWVSWGESNAANIVDFGNPVGITEKLSNAGVSWGDHKVLGYGIMQANSKEEMYEVLKSNPHMSWHNEATIEVSEIVDMMG